MHIFCMIYIHSFCGLINSYLTYTFEFSLCPMQKCLAPNLPDHIQRTRSAHSEITQRSLRGHSEVTKCTVYTVHSDIIQRSFREHVENTQGTFRNIQRTLKEQKGTLEPFRVNEEVNDYSPKIWKEHILFLVIKSALRFWKWWKFFAELRSVPKVWCGALLRSVYVSQNAVFAESPAMQQPICIQHRLKKPILEIRLNGTEQRAEV